MRCKSILLILTIIFLITLIYGAPTIQFEDPTPSNNFATNNTNFEINVSIIEESNIQDFIFNWNGTNYTFYDDNLFGLMNFNNISTLNENDTYIVDHSTYGNNGTVYGGAQITTTSKYGKAIDLIDDGDYVDYGNINLTGNQLTIAWWMKVDSNSGLTTSSNLAPVIIDWMKGSPSAYQDGTLLCYIKTNPGWSGGNYLTNSTLCTYSSSNSQLNDLGTDFNSWYGGWHHVAFTLDGTDFRAYVDGLPNGTKTGAANISPENETLAIGHRNWNYGEYFDGQIDELRIYNKTFSADEIQELYMSNFERNKTNLTEGNYTYQIFSSNSSGNFSSSEERTIIIDTTLPNITLNNPPQDHSNETNPYIDFNCSTTDNIGLKNMSLHLTDNTNSSFSLNQTTNISGIADEANWTLRLSNGNYTWNCLVNDLAENLKWGGNRSIIMNYTDTTYPSFSNYSDNTATFSGSGTALFNVSIETTNGTVLLEINSTNYTATNLISNIYNASVFLTQGTYDYRWHAYGDGYDNNYNVSENQTYVVNSLTIPDSPSTSGGPTEGTSQVSTQEECIENSDCPKNKFCFENNCVKLFDIVMLEIESPKEIKDTLNFVYFIKGIADINGDVIVKYWIQTENTKINLGQDTIFIGTNEEKTQSAELYIPSNVERGVYEFIVEINYDTYSATSFRIIEVISPVEEIHEVVYSKITNEYKGYTAISISILSLILVIILIILIAKKNNWGTKKQHSPTSVKGAIGKLVYGADGTKIGEVKEVHLENDKIHNWVVEVNKDITKKLGHKTVLILQKDLESVGEAIIVKKGVSEHLKKLIYKN